MIAALMDEIYALAVSGADGQRKMQLVALEWNKERGN